MTVERPIRVLLVKLGLDGHDRGVKVVLHILRDAGMEVIYTGRRSRTEDVIKTVEEEDVDVVGVSLLNNNHLSISRRLVAAMREAGLDDVPIVLGGIIPKQDVPALKEIGVSEVFHVHSEPADIVQRITALAQSRRAQEEAP